MELFTEFILMEQKTELEYLYSEYVDKLELPPLESIRSTISTFYTQTTTSKYFSFVYLARIMNRRFVKKMVHDSDFTFPIYAGMAFIVLGIYTLINRGKVDTFYGDGFRFDTFFLIMLGIALFVSAYPFFVASFNRNAQEKKREVYYLVDLVKVVLAFFLLLSLMVFPLSWFGFVEFSIRGIYNP